MALESGSGGEAGRILRSMTENLNSLVQTVSGNMDFKDAAGEGSEGRIIVIENWKKGDPINKW